MGAAPPLTPPPKLAETMLLGAHSTPVCPENSYPLSEEGCDQAASILKKSYHPHTDAEGPQGGWPSGCSHQTYNDVVKWNPHFPGSYTGRSNQYAKPICTTAATLAAPTPDPAILFGAAETNACPENSNPVDREECEQVARDVDMPFEDKSVHYYPKGCTLWRLKTVMWNSHPTGRVFGEPSYEQLPTGMLPGEARQICTTAATPAI